MTANRSPRIAPLSSPYESEIAAILATWMPPDSSLELLKLFRTLLHQQELSRQSILLVMNQWKDRGDGRTQNSTKIRVIVVLMLILALATLPG